MYEWEPQLVILPVYPFHISYLGCWGQPWTTESQACRAKHVFIDIHDWPLIKCRFMVTEMPKMMPRLTTLETIYTTFSHHFIDSPFFLHVFPMHPILCRMLGVRQVPLPAPLLRARVLYPWRVPLLWYLGRCETAGSCWFCWGFQINGLVCWGKSSPETLKPWFFPSNW